MANAAPGGTGGRPVSLDELIALNDEIIALTRAGIPLESGLMAVGSDLPGRLKKMTTQMAERMSHGESLPQALAASDGGVPRVYSAAVEAGLRSGRLSTALESLAGYARGYADARRSMILALAYPTLILLLAYALFLAIATLLVPRLVGTFESLGLRMPWSIRVLGWLGENAVYWGPILPVLLLALLVLSQVSGRADSLGGSRGFGLMRRLPWVGSMIRGYEAASFADFLAMLLEHEVPYHEALVLAGEASGDPRLARSAQAVADAVGKGLPPGGDRTIGNEFPPLLRWQLRRNSTESDMIASLHTLARRYRGDARYYSDALRLFLPTAVLFGFGATATLLYALAIFIPLTNLWSGLSAQAP